MFNNVILVQENPSSCQLSFFIQNYNNNQQCLSVFAFVSSAQSFYCRCGHEQRVQRFLMKAMKEMLQRKMSEAFDYSFCYGKREFRILQ